MYVDDNVDNGTIEFEMKATGIISTVACVPGKPEKYGTEVSPGVVGQIHQHLVLFNHITLYIQTNVVWAVPQVQYPFLAWR